MSEQQQGPGWWLASDGRWYPPEQAHSVVAPGGWAMPNASPYEAQPGWAGPPPVPVPPSRGMSTGAKIALTVGSLLGVVVVLAIVVSLLGSSAEHPTAVTLTDTAPTSFARFEDPGGDFALDLHPEWIGLSLRGDVAGVGAAAAPDAPDTAAVVDALVSALPRQVVFAAVDGERLGASAFMPNMNLIPVPRDGATIEEIEVEIPESVQAFGAGAAHVERVATNNGVGLRMTYKFLGDGPLSGVEGVQYYVLADDTVWILTMTSDEMAKDRADFDASASSFTLR